MKLRQELDLMKDVRQNMMSDINAGIISPGQLADKLGNRATFESSLIKVSLFISTRFLMVSFWIVYLYLTPILPYAVAVNAKRNVESEELRKYRGKVQQLQNQLIKVCINDNV